ncbi:hypothetical protein H2200_013042 [Cladophialophora chaetospira]|uniref:Uncharacterized protein n=1 Tax=Cladophialophora chaetospira TaxID=386627 RepID=A0AA38WWM7_9EURO|nr:hypothetical protein H2200_013042 [Cladophialophora chaetospira]
MAPLAAILCGREPKLAEAMVRNLSPKIEVVHVCTTQETAMSEIPALLRGETITAASGLGTNAEGASRTDVSLIILGGGNSKDNVEEIKAAADAVKPLPLLWADVSKMSGGGRPSPEGIRDRIFECLEREGKDGGAPAPGIHMW